MPTPSAKLFTLEGKGLKLDTAADIEAHIKPLRAMNDVVEVRLLGNTLGVEACKALGEVLATKKSLEIANLADIFTARLLSEIPPALSHLLESLLALPRLHTINLSDNAFGLNTVAPLTSFLSAHAPLQHLILQNNGLGPHAGILVADALSTLHAKKVAARQAGKDIPELETVICGRNRLENGSMAAWAKTFALHTGVKEVRMVQNGIRQEGIAHLLLEGLGKVKTLQRMDLQDNTFTIKGARALVRVLGGWSELRELGVGDCLVGKRGSLRIAEELAKGRNASLMTLRMQYNNTAIQTMAALLAALKKNALPKLQRVDISGNPFDEDEVAVQELKELLEERKEKVAETGEPVIEDDWGLEGLDDLEEVDSDDEGSAEEGNDDADDDDDAANDERPAAQAERREKLIREEQEAQEEPTVQVKDKEVDRLADELGQKVNI